MCSKCCLDLLEGQGWCGHVLTHRGTRQPVITALLTGANVSNHRSRVALHASSPPGGRASCFAAVCWVFLRRFRALSLNSSGLGTEEIQQRVLSAVSRRWYVAGWRHPRLSQARTPSSPVLAGPGR